MKQLAVIKSGGKQYLVFPGKKIRVEKLDKKEGEKIEFDVLLLKDEKGVRLGCPLVEGAKVEGRVLKQGKSKKVVVFKRKEEISGEEGSSPVVHRGRNNQNLLKTLFFKSGAFFQVSETDRPLVKV